MATAQKTKSDTISSQQSLVLVKNMFRLSVSSICFLRGIFPEDCFSTKDYAGVKVHQLECAEKDKDGQLIVLEKDAFLLTQWLERGVFDALERSFLKSLTFSIYKRSEKERQQSPETDGVDENDILLECYNFGIEYTNNSLSLNGVAMTRDTLKKQAVSFIRCLIEFSNTLDTLPEERYLSMKLSYYDDMTPTGYEPEFFRKGQNVIKFISKPVKVRIGSLKTPHLSMALKFAGLESYELLDEPTNETSAPVSASDDRKMFSQHLNSPSELEWTVPDVLGKCSKKIEKGVNKTSHQGKQVKQGIAEVADLRQQMATSSLQDRLAATASENDDDVEDIGDEDPDGRYEELKSFVLSSKRSQLKECASKFSLDMTRVRDFFQRLVAEGILVRRGTSYKVIVCSASKNDSRRCDAQVTGIVSEPDAHQSWQQGPRKQRACATRQVECDVDDEQTVESEMSRDLLERPVDVNENQCNASSSQESCDSIVFTSSPYSPVKLNRGAPQEHPRSTSAQASRGNKQYSHHEKQIEETNKDNKGCLDLVYRSAVSADTNIAVNDDDDVTVGHCDTEAAMEVIQEDTTALLSTLSKRQHFYLSQDGESVTVATSQRPSKLHKKCSVIAQPIYQQTL